MNSQQTVDSIDAVAIACGVTEENKGFREDWQRADWLEALADYLAKEERFTTDITKPFDESTVEGLRSAAVALRNNYVGMKLMLIVSELAEALDTLRDHGVDELRNGHGNFGEELADSHIRLFALEHLLATDPSGNIVSKMDINKDRPHKHGRVI